MAADLKIREATTVTPYKIRVRIENVGDSSTDYRLRIRDSGAADVSKKLTLAAGEEYVNTFDFSEYAIRYKVYAEWPYGDFNNVVTKNAEAPFSAADMEFRAGIRRSPKPLAAQFEITEATETSSGDVQIGIKNTGARTGECGYTTRDWRSTSQGTIVTLDGGQSTTVTVGVDGEIEPTNVGAQVSYPAEAAEFDDVIVEHVSTQRAKSDVVSEPDIRGAEGGDDGLFPSDREFLSGIRTENLDVLKRALSGGDYETETHATAADREGLYRAVFRDDVAGEDNLVPPEREYWAGIRREKFTPPTADIVDTNPGSTIDGYFQSSNIGFKIRNHGDLAIETPVWLVDVLNDRLIDSTTLSLDPGQQDGDSFLYDPANIGGQLRLATRTDRIDIVDDRLPRAIASFPNDNTIDGTASVPVGGAGGHMGWGAAALDDSSAYDGTSVTSSLDYLRSDGGTIETFNSGFPYTQTTSGGFSLSVKQNGGKDDDYYLSGTVSDTASRTVYTSDDSFDLKANTEYRYSTKLATDTGGPHVKSIGTPFVTPDGSEGVSVEAIVSGGTAETTGVTIRADGTSDTIATDDGDLAFWSDLGVTLEAPMRPVYGGGWGVDDSGEFGRLVGQRDAYEFDTVDVVEAGTWVRTELTLDGSTGEHAATITNLDTGASESISLENGDNLDLVGVPTGLLFRGDSFAAGDRLRNVSLSAGPVDRTWDSQSAFDEWRPGFYGGSRTTWAWDSAGYFECQDGPVGKWLTVPISLSADLSGSVTASFEASVADGRFGRAELVVLGT